METCTGVILTDLDDEYWGESIKYEEEFQKIVDYVKSNEENSEKPGTSAEFPIGLIEPGFDIYSGHCITMFNSWSLKNNIGYFAVQLENVPYFMVCKEIVFS